ncbi:MAG: hypothetical protein ACLU4P_06575 [Ruminococcus sp.]
MIAVDQASMTGKIVSCDLWHSFAQYIKSQSSYLLCSGAKRGFPLYQTFQIRQYHPLIKTIELLPYGGSRTSVWGTELLRRRRWYGCFCDSVLCIGTTIDQSQYDK